MAQRAPLVKDAKSMLMPATAGQASLYPHLYDWDDILKLGKTPSVSQRNTNWSSSQSLTLSLDYF
jgi:hypothetical protein